MKYKRIVPVVVIFFCLIFSFVDADQRQFTGEVVSIFDGDTIGILFQGQEQRIRLYGIDCPERGQAFGRNAKQFTSEFVFRKLVTVIAIDRDRYDRTVASFLPQATRILAGNW
jgi:micrococcal nuclease